jgi:streptogramin lyase
MAKSVCLALRFTQEEDSAGRTGYESQQLSVSFVDAGGGPYIVIDTTRWATDSVADLVALLDTAQAAFDRLPRGDA